MKVNWIGLLVKATIAAMVFAVAELHSTNAAIALSLYILMTGLDNKIPD